VIQRHYYLLPGLRPGGFLLSGLRPGGFLLGGLRSSLAVLAAIGVVACSTPPSRQSDAPSTPAPTQSAMSITSAPFGTVGNTPVHLYTLTNKNGLIAKITNYGAIVTELHVPDRAGRLADVVLGFDNLDDYLGTHPYFGAIVGRVANRIANAAFTLDGKRYPLAANDAPHHLHGGKKGWDKVVWNATTNGTAQGPSLELTYTSTNGEEGYPGAVTAKTVYTLTHDNELKVEMEATTDAPTIVNMAHHSYWNLGGYNSGTILDHELTLHADRYTPGTPMVPDGRMTPVAATPFDFTTAKTIGKDLKHTGLTPIGYDHNFVVNGDPNQLRAVARLKDPKSGRVMTISADQPGVQFYSGNFLDGSINGKGATYGQHTGLCLETQKFPNAINVPAWQDQVILRPGRTYRHVMVHKFSVEQ
jgi:aldose 1-epimerase